MEINATPKEIAAIVLELQERPKKNYESESPLHNMKESLTDALGNLATHDTISVMNQNVDLTKIKQLSETHTLAEANDLVKNGWMILTIVASNNKMLFSLGR